ncbi:acyl carrier protein [Amylibacter sp.]|nr:acyl carrier protein [Amylibacter sp.]
MAEQRSDRLIEMLEQVLETEKLPMEGDVDFKVQDYWDSLKYMSLVLEIETEFQISLSRAELQQITTLSGIEKVLVEKNCI